MRSILWLLMVILLADPIWARDPVRRQEPLMTDWRFLRGHAPGAEKPEFDDSSWRQVDLPHDWSIENLPPRSEDPLFHVITLVPGPWRFKFGDDPAWKEPDYDDSGWQLVETPAEWSWYGDATGDEVRTGWFRRRIVIPEEAAGKAVLIQLGLIHDLDDTYVDGVKVRERSLGDIYWSNVRVTSRVYLLRGGLGTPGEHTVAVRVMGKADGGLVAGALEAPTEGPCDPGRSAGGINTGYAVGGTGWYRKRFTLPESDRDKAVRVVFDGSYYETTVWLNGVEAGRNVYGYTPFGFDLTPYLKSPGQENVLAVRVDNPGENSRWYSGSGLYRPVHLEVTSTVHIAPWGMFLTTPEVSPGFAKVQAEVEIANPQGAPDTLVRLRITDPDGKPAGTAETPTSSDGSVASLQVSISTPRLWSPETPFLYVAEVELLAGDRLLDHQSVPFGIRTIAWNATQGFLLNGQPVELRGGCIHHDHGPLGAASFPVAEERRVAKLKAAGYNAIRCAHNPPASSLLDACDRLGMLVIDEAFDMWNKGGNPEDYHRFFKDWWKRDIEAMVKRDRNHPSVIMWSIGNEIRERFEPLGVETAHALANYVRALDRTRPVTSAFNSVSDKADPYFAALDICGYNYNPDRYEIDHDRHPNRLILGTESFARDSFDYWEKVVRLPYVIGDFIWTAWDYRGESGIGHTIQKPEQDNAYLMPWPWHNAFCGDFDVCGHEKPQGLYRQVLWGVRPMALLVERPASDGSFSKADRWGWPDETPSWTWPGAEGQEMKVRVYGAGEEVALELNGEEIGRRPVGEKLTTEFCVAYKPGRLIALLKRSNGEISEAELRTAGRIAGLRIAAEQGEILAARDSLAFINIEAVDEEGRLIPIETRDVEVEVAGPGRLVAFGNGDPTDTRSVQDARQRLWRGRALAVIRSNGEAGTLTITARAATLPPAQCVVTVRK